VLQAACVEGASVCNGLRQSPVVAATVCLPSGPTRGLRRVRRHPRCGAAVRERAQPTIRSRCEPRQQETQPSRVPRSTDRAQPFARLREIAAKGPTLGRAAGTSDLPMCANVQITFRRASNIQSRGSPMTDADAVLAPSAPHNPIARCQ